MKTLTATLTVSDQPVPANQTSAWAGFRCRVTNVTAGTSSVTAVQTSATFTFAPSPEGTQYSLVFESVDAAGNAIQILAALTTTAPAAQTFKRIDNVQLAWV